jgi:hypothetical protein
MLDGVGEDSIEAEGCEEEGDDCEYQPALLQSRVRGGCFPVPCGDDT